MKARLSIESHFDAAHYLPNYPGKCANLHGHTYRTIIEIEGEINEKTGMLIDFTTLKKEVHRIIDKLDHTLLNNIIPNPTAENIAKWIKFQLLKSEELKKYDNINNIKVTIYEGLNNSATV